MRFALFFFALYWSAWAQPLAPPEIETLKARLAEARRIGSVLDGKMGCYENKDSSFQVHSSELQEAVGEMYRQKQELSQALDQARTEYEGNRRHLDETWQEMDRLQRQIMDIEMQIRVRQADLNDCKSRWWVPNFLCDFAGELMGLNGELERLAAESDARNNKARSLRLQLDSANLWLNQAETQFQNKMAELTQVERNISSDEGSVRMIKASLFEIRMARQEYLDQRFRLEKSLAELEGLNPAADSRFVLNRLRSESAGLDSLLLMVQSLSGRRIVLPDGELICPD